MKHLAFTSLLLILFVACQPVNHESKNQSDESKLDQLSWMLGKWQMETPDGVVTEEWLKPSDTQWQGSSYLITANGDTPFHENIRLNYSNDTLYYIPRVSGQNDDKEVSFTERSISDSIIVFENLRHDFPQRITYKRVSDTSIVAAVEGTQNGQLRKEEFAYVKRK
jgi:hypothetical protein